MSLLFNPSFQCTANGLDLYGSLFTEKGSEVRDVAIIFAAQKVEHYEIAS